MRNFFFIWKHPTQGGRGDLNRRLGTGNCLVLPIVLAVQKIENSSKCAILVVPAWTSSFFWPVLLPDGTHAQVSCVKISMFHPCLQRGTYCKQTHSRDNSVSVSCLSLITWNRFFYDSRVDCIPLNSTLPSMLGIVLPFVQIVEVHMCVVERNLTL